MQAKQRAHDFHRKRKQAASCHMNVNIIGFVRPPISYFNIFFDTTISNNLENEKILMELYEQKYKNKEEQEVVRTIFKEYSLSWNV